MSNVTKTCRISGKQFVVTDADQFMLDKLSPVIAGKKYALPLPKLCPEERLRRRLCHINQMNLYQRKCNATGETIISHFSENNSRMVYSQKYYYSDQWDPMDYGRGFDFSRSFFEQCAELHQAVPHPALYTDFTRDENSDYTNYCGLNKNAYMLFDCGETEDCFYSYGIQKCRDCMDCYRCQHVERSYECIDCSHCYETAYLQNCQSCHDAFFLLECRQCSHCLFCVNLLHKDYHVFNEPVSEAEYQKIRKELSTYSGMQKYQQKWQEFQRQFPKRALQVNKCDNVVGNYLYECHNAYDCFDCRELEDGRYCYNVFAHMKDAMDVNHVGMGELAYECIHVGVNMHTILFSMQCLRNIHNYMYCIECDSSSDLFGCVGLRKKKYCILNKQYTKEEYEKLVPKIIEHMQETGGWGEFFPSYMSPFAYNETVAQEYFPETKEGAKSLHMSWKAEFLHTKNTFSTQIVQAKDLPDSIVDVKDDISNTIVICEFTGKPYRIVKQELDLYRDMDIPIPRLHPNERHRRRLAKRNLRRFS